MKNFPRKNEKIRQQRLLHNWTLQNIANELGTTTTTVQRWERGSQRPSLYYRGKLCVLFGLSPQELGFEEEALPSSSDHTEAASDHTEAEAAKVEAEEIALWTVPYVCNPHFTGRDNLLNELEQRFASPEADQDGSIRQIALTQAQAITGLGGIGKTQTAVEYAYRALAQERYVHTLWITAASEETILTGFCSLAEQLPDLSSRKEADQHKIAMAVIRWLEQCEQPWLLIFDNADDLSFVPPYLPRRGSGSILLTTRANAVGSFASSIEVETLGVLEGTQLLLRRAQRWEGASEEEINEAANLVVALGQFPLALDQAGAYIEETQCEVQDYLQLYQQHRLALLARRGKQIIGYPEPVATAWSLSFQRVEQIQPAAAELLRLCAFLAPDHIPEELLTTGAPYWPPALQQAVADPFTFNQLLEVLLQFSLVKRLPKDHQLSIHRLVQAVQIESMEPQKQRQWVERVICAVNTVLPRSSIGEVAYWPQYQRLLEQTQACDQLIQEYQLYLPEATDLLDRTGSYLCERALYALAEPLLQRALNIREQQMGPEQLPTATSLHHLAVLYWKLGKYAQAELLHLRALRIREQHLGSEHPDLAEVANDLGLLYAKQGKYAQAEPLHLRALRIGEPQLGPDHPRVAVLYNNLASLYQHQGKYAQAEPLYLRALRIHEQQRDPVNPLLAASFHNLGALYQKMRKPDLAEPLYQRALQIYEQKLGTEHPSVGITLTTLATIYYDRGEYGQTEQLCQRTLRIYERQLGSEHPSLGYPLHWLALVFARQGRYEESERLERRALRIWEEKLGSEHPSVAYPLHGLALLFAQQKREQEAEAFFRRALHIHEQQPRETDLVLADILHDFAAFQQTLGHFPEAASLYQRTLAIREPALGPDHSLTIETREHLHAVQIELSKRQPCNRI